MENPTQSLPREKRIELKGVIKGEQSIQLGHTLSEFEHDTYTKIVLDLSEVTFIDSCGIGALLYWRQIFEKAKIELILTAPSAFIKNFFRDCRLDQVFSIIPAIDGNVD